ncbi:MAG: tRNA epoxyqueuosine(34) reductase QueG [Vicinamibacterales bacterium]|nr:tRNA epoxyqueuosine(34) reductase QueG [Vicinamibacterales bacterium]
MVTSEAVAAHARTLGFDRCGVAPATALPELDRIHDWLARGHAGEMRYLARSAGTRADIRRFLPSAQSVIVTATRYDAGRPPGAGTPAIARYAQGRDYHLVLAERLQRLLDWMREEAGAPFEAAIFVDKHHVQERVFAAYAGLGFIGKHSLLIDPELGSWMLLGGLACALPLEPGTPIADQCGACTLCLDACPTGAIVEPREVDARRCLSYLTIELEGPIPEPLRPSVGPHLFGCDVCQEVCPFNFAPAPTTDPAWQPQAGRDHPDPVALWQRPDDGLHALVAGSAMTHTSLSRLRRNLAVAIGNTGDAEAIAALDRPGDGVRNAAHSAEAPVVRDAVRWAKSRAPR